MLPSGSIGMLGELATRTNTGSPPRSRRVTVNSRNEIPGLAPANDMSESGP